MKSNNKVLFLTGLMFCLMSLPLPAAQAAVESAPGTSEDLFFAQPATVHNYKNKWDLHSIITNTLSVMDLEFLRIGDSLVSLPIRGNYEPFTHAADFAQFSFYRIPQITPIRRIEQLGDALQIRQLGLSDIRFLNAASSGNLGGGFSPIMLTRFFKIVILVEDVINDADQLILYPVNQTASHFKDHPVHLRLLGYPADGLGFVRIQLYSLVRTINKTVVKASSSVVFGAEALHNQYRRHRRMKKNSDYLLHLRVPASVYKANKFYLDRTAKKMDRPSENGAVWLTVRMRDWQKAPHTLFAYIIQEDELPSLPPLPDIKKPSTVFTIEGE